MSEKAEKRDLSEFIHTFFKKTAIGYFKHSSKTTVQIRCCVDLDCNVVPESENKITIDFSYEYGYPIESE